MRDDSIAPAADGRRYRAFLSYSHRDAAAARRLHARLEQYRLPRRLVGRATPLGPVPARLAPIFRDREELPAATDLSAAVRDALADSAALIVVATPAARGSAWVDREIALFRALHPDRPLLVALLDGEPAKAFPPALAAGGEPLAADLRPGRDGRRLGLLKLVSGLVGAPLDQLIRRDAQRQLRRVMAVTGVALVLALGMALLAAAALDARAEAERQQQRGEQLIEFMLTDLRRRLKGVGRLDVMAAVNRQALRHYAGTPLGRLPAESLMRRARVLHANGEDDVARGRFDAARAQFDEAHRTTTALLAKAPDDPARIFVHAQSEFWLGLVDFENGRRKASLPAFRRYRALAGRLVDLAPNEPDHLRELAYAEGNLCSVALAAPVAARAALDHCGAALAWLRRAAARLPADQALAIDLMNRHAWLADARLATGDLAGAAAERARQAALLAREMRADPASLDLRDIWLTLQLALADLDRRAGRCPAATGRLARARTAAAAMLRHDPDNALWANRHARIATQLKLCPPPKG